MTNLPLLSEAHVRRIEPYFLLSRGRARVDDRRVLSGIIYAIRNGLMWRDAPPGYGPPKTIYNRFVRWSRAGVFNRIFAGLAADGGSPGQLMVDANPPQGAPHPCVLTEKGAAPRRIGRTKAGLNSKLHAFCDKHGRTCVMLLSARQMSDYKGAALMLDAMPAAPVLIDDRGYDADWLRKALRARGTRPPTQHT